MRAEWGVDPALDIETSDSEVAGDLLIGMYE